MITRHEIDLKCATLNGLLGLPLETFSDFDLRISNVGNIHVELLAFGYLIMQTKTTSGTMSFPFGGDFMTAEECGRTLDTACHAVRMCQERAALKEVNEWCPACDNARLIKDGPAFKICPECNGQSRELSKAQSK